MKRFCEVLLLFQFFFCFFNFWGILLKLICSSSSSQIKAKFKTSTEVLILNELVPSKFLLLYDKCTPNEAVYLSF